MIKELRTINGKEVVGELTYADPCTFTPRVSWRAAVTTDYGVTLDSKESEQLELVYTLWIQVGDAAAFQSAGTFFSVEALVKYVRDITKERYKETPVIDTLRKLHSPHGIAVPRCYNIGPCALPLCSFYSTCTFRNPIRAEGTGFAEPGAESEEDFLRRLADKISAKKWED